MNDSMQAGGSITLPDTSNALLDAARAELTEIATNPANPRHAGYHRGDKTVSEYLDSLYKKAVPETPPQGTPTDPAPLREPDQDHTVSAQDRVAQTEVESLLRQTLGDSYDSDMRDMGIGAQHLFATPDGRKMLEALSPLITDLGPLAQVRGIRFLAEIGQLVKQQGGRS